MKIACICNRTHRDYLIRTFETHPEMDAVATSFPAWGTADQDNYRGIPIISLSELKSESQDIILLAISSGYNLIRVLVKLHEMNLRNVYFIRLSALENQEDFIKDGAFDLEKVSRTPEGEEKPVFGSLDIHVCDHCNLSCKSCHHFAPFVKERKIIDIHKFESDMGMFAALFSDVARIVLLGGEPLLEPDICVRMIEIIRGYFSKTDIVIFTNGLLIPKMSKQFWDAIRTYRVTVQISLYPPFEKKMPEFERELKKHCVTYRVVDLGYFAQILRSAPTGDAEFNNKRCSYRGCWIMYDGALAKCPQSALASRYIAGPLGVNPAQMECRDMIRLREVTDGWEALKKLLQPCDFCKWCKVWPIESTEWVPTGRVPDARQWLIATDREDA